MRFNILASDLDGDSLGYELTAPLYIDIQKQIKPAPGYTIPEGFGINRFGEIYWNNPTKMGEYVHTVRITQYRKGQVVGTTLLDIQFLVITRSSYEHYKARLENQSELAFLPDGQLLVKPGEKVKLLVHFFGGADKSWESELQDKGIEDISFKRISPELTEFSFTATEALSRRHPYGINFNFKYFLEAWRDVEYTFTIPILIWQPKPVELSLIRPADVPLTAEGHIKSILGHDLKLLFFAHNGLGNVPSLSVESSLSQGAELFSFVTRDSADSVVGELRFKPSASQVSSTPYSITIRSTSMQLRTTSGAVAASDELVLRVLVTNPAPLSSAKDLSIGTAKVFPNPATDGFTVESPELPGLYLQLHDVLGKTVAEYVLKPGENRLIRPASLPHGLYFYTLTSRDKPVSSGRLVFH